VNDILSDIDAFNPQMIIVGILGAQICLTMGTFMAYVVGQETGLNEAKPPSGCYVFVGYILTALIGLFFVLQVGLKWMGVGILVGITLKMMWRIFR